MKVIDHNASEATVQLGADELWAIGRAMYLAVSEGGERDDQVLAVGRKLADSMQTLAMDMGDDADSDD